MMRRFSPLLFILLIPGCLTSGRLGDTPRPPTPTPLLDASGQPIPELEVTGQALPAGTYTRDVFEPRITLDLNGDWEAVQLLEGFFDVQQFKESPDVYAVQFANPTNVDTAEEAVASLRANDDLVELESSTSLIDGQEGLQITVENTSGSAARRSSPHRPEHSPSTTAAVCGSPSSTPMRASWRSWSAARLISGTRPSRLPSPCSNRFASATEATLRC